MLNIVIKWDLRFYGFVWDVLIWFGFFFVVIFFIWLGNDILILGVLDFVGIIY